MHCSIFNIYQPKLEESPSNTTTTKKPADIVKIISGLRTNIRNVNVSRPFEKGKDNDSFFCDIVGKTVGRLGTSSSKIKIPNWNY